jgi:transcriptional regulator with XRE-family HTH domain
MPTTVDHIEGRSLERIARQIRTEGQLSGWCRERIVDEMLARLPGLQKLEAHRLAEGWTRREMSDGIDLLYLHDGLEPPNLRTSEISNWERGRRLPNPERQEYLCRLYRTRPDRLGFGKDFTGRPEGHDERCQCGTVIAHSRGA